MLMQNLAFLTKGSLFMLNLHLIYQKKLCKVTAAYTNHTN